MRATEAGCGEWRSRSCAVSLHVRHEWEEQQIYSEHCCLVTCPVSAGWPLRVASQLTETLSIHSCSERVRLLLQLYRPSFSRSPALLSWDLLLPSTFQLRLQSDGKPLLATHTSVAVFFEEICALEGGRTLTLGRVTPDKHTTLNSRKHFSPFRFIKNIWTINTVLVLWVILATLNCKSPELIFTNPVISKAMKVWWNILI